MKLASEDGNHRPTRLHRLITGKHRLLQEENKSIPRSSILVSSLLSVHREEQGALAEDRGRAG